MNDNELQQLELNIKQSQKIVDLGDSLERLRNNRDFKKVIGEGYFEQEAIRLVHLKADPCMQSSDSQKAILVQMDSIGALSDFFRLVAHKASMARKGIESDEQTREELLVESL